MNLQELGLYDIYGLHNVPFWHTAWFVSSCIAIGIALVTALFLFMLYIWMQNKKKKQMLCWQQALCETDKLVYSLDASEISTSKAYDQLFFILKQYLSVRYKTDVLEKTDSEIVAYLLQEKIVTDAQQLTALFDRSVYAKFAQKNIDKKIVKSDCFVVQQFVRDTIPKQQETR